MRFWDRRRSPWGLGWRGWWGDEEPPYHAPVFGLTNRPRELLATQRVIH